MNDMLTFLQHYLRVGGAMPFLQYDITNKLFSGLFEVSGKQLVFLVH